MAVILGPLNMSLARIQILAVIVMQLAQLALVPQLMSVVEVHVQLIMFMMVRRLQQTVLQFLLVQVQNM